jgi:uncharacterized membrane protein (UPF0127 family)
MEGSLARPALLALLLLPLAGCSMAADGPTVELKGRAYTVEVADEVSEQARGLMFRRELAPDHGMLFVYPAAEPQAYWMRNCHIPLDIMYFDGAGKFVSAHYNVPPCNAAQCPSYPSKAPARYVLELGGGVGKALELAPGDVLTLPQ